MSDSPAILDQSAPIKVRKKSGPKKSRKRICKEQLESFEEIVTALRDKALKGDAAAAKAWLQIVKENVGVTVAPKKKSSKSPLDNVLEGLPTRTIPQDGRESTFSTSPLIIKDLETKPGVSPADAEKIESKSPADPAQDGQEAGGNGGNENPA